MPYTKSSWPHLPSALHHVMRPLAMALIISGCDGAGHSAQLVGASANQATGALSLGEGAVYHPQRDASKCLDVNMGNKANGTPVQLATCYANDDAQVWTYSDGMLKVFGNMCLDVTDGVQQNGTKLQIWECSNTNANQQWTQQGQTFVWRNKFCLDLTDGNTQDLTRIQIWECFSGNVNQQWTGVAADSGAPSGNGNQPKSDAPASTSPNTTTTAPSTSQGTQNMGNNGAASGSSADGYTSNTVGASATVLTQPAGSISVIDFGAKNDGSGDNTQALQNAFNAAATQGKTVWIPQGTYSHSGIIKINGIKVMGAGASAILKATAEKNSAVTLTGQNSSLSNVATQVSAPSRSSQPYDCAVLVIGAKNAQVSYVSVQGASANGFRVDSSDQTIVTKCLSNGTNADGVALVNHATNSKISYTQVVNAADDSFSSNSYPGEQQNNGNTFERCYAGPNSYQGRGYVLNGSFNETVTQCVSVGSLWNGMTAGRDGDSTTLSGYGFTFKNNLIMGNASGRPIIISSDNGKTEASNAASLATVTGTQTSGDVATFLGWTPISGLPHPSTFSSYRGGGPGSNNTAGNRQ